MFTQTLTALTGRLGHSTKDIRKVVAWQFRPDAGVVIEKPTRDTASRFWVLIPYTPGTEIPAKSELGSRE